MSPYRLLPSRVPLINAPLFSLVVRILVRATDRLAPQDRALIDRCSRPIFSGKDEKNDRRQHEMPKHGVLPRQETLSAGTKGRENCHRDKQTACLLYDSEQDERLEERLTLTRLSDCADVSILREQKLVPQHRGCT